MDSNNKASIWKYLNSASTFSWIELPSIVNYSYSSMVFNNDYLFLIGKDISTVTQFHMYKVSFSYSSYYWGKKLSWISDCSPSSSESLLSSDESKIYSLFILESTPYAYFVTLSSIDGSVVGSRYKSSISWSYVLGSTKSGSYLLFLAYCSSTYNLFIYNTDSSTFSINSWTAYLIGITTEPSSGK